MLQFESEYTLIVFQIRMCCWNIPNFLGTVWDNSLD